MKKIEIMSKSVITLNNEELILINIPFKIFKKKEKEIEIIVRECISKYFLSLIDDDVKNEIKRKINELFIPDIRKEKLKKLNSNSK